MKLFSLSVFLIFINISSSAFSQVSTQWRSIYNSSASDTDLVTAMTIDGQNNTYVTGYSTGYGTGKDIATVKYNQNGNQEWVSVYNNSNANLDDIPTGIAVDNSGNVYVTGHSKGVNTFEDYLTIKYSSTGKLLWASLYNGKGNDDDIATAIVTDHLGNIFVTGYSVGSFTSEDYTTIKYNPDGTEQWIEIYDNSDANDIDIATSIALDNSGNIFVTGYSIGTGSEEDYATVKYNYLGVEMWSARYNGPANGYDITSGLAVDNDGNVYVTGYSLGIGSEEDYATLKYDSQGNAVWTSRYNGPSNSFDISNSIAVDTQRNVFVTGYSNDNASYEDYLTIKYNSSGAEQWTQRYNGAGGDFDIAVKVKVDPKGNSYVTGYSYDFGTEENFVTLKYNPDGVRLWEQIFNNDVNGSDIATNLEVDNSDNVYIAGYSYEGVTNADYVTIKYSQSTGISQNSGSVPGSFMLSQNYPNPFNPTTVINYVVKGQPSNVKLIIFDVLGNEIETLVNEKQLAGSYRVQFDGSKLSSGTYFYKLDAGDFSQTKKMILLK